LVRLFAGALSPVPAFPFAGSDGAVRWRVKNRPEAAIALEREKFTEMVAEAGLDLIWIEPGFWPGASATVGGQDIVFLSRAGGTR
jgi:hypothetical protein